MNRTLRNGLAVAGMAGGMIFLGQAVANADQGNTNTSGQVATAEAEGDDSQAGNVNVTGQANVSDTSTTVVNAPVQKTGDASNTTTITLPANAPAKVEIDDATINQTATTGSISGGNQQVTLPPAAPVTQTNTNTTHQVATAESEDDKRGGNYGNNNSRSNSGGGSDEAEAGNVNLTGQLNLHDGSTTIINRPYQSTGDATNNVHLDFSNANFYCGDEKLVLTSNEGPRKCEYTIKIQDLTINQTATSGSISGGNQTVGAPAAPAPAPVHHAKPAHHHKAAAPAHHAKPVHHAPVRHAAPVSTTAQPKGSLAYTGAETTAPLALGLIALGAGGALTLAGRRRSTTATV
jgi:hypothetical protein